MVAATTVAISDTAVAAPLQKRSFVLGVPKGVCWAFNSVVMHWHACLVCEQVRVRPAGRGPRVTPPYTSEITHTRACARASCQG